MVDRAGKWLMNVDNRRVIILFATWLVIVNIFAVFAANRFNLDGDTAYRWINLKSGEYLQTWNIVKLHTKWDSNFYLRIAERGYEVAKGDDLSHIVFLPLYPFLMKLVSLITGATLGVSGWLISITCLLLALLMLFQLVKKHHPEIDPHAPLALLLIFPTAFFLNAVYTEALYLFLVVGAFYFALEKKFAIAVIFGLFAALTKIPGVLLFIPIVWEYLRSKEFSPRKAFRPQLALFGLIPAGTLAFFYSHYLRFGDFWIYFKVDADYFGRTIHLKINEFTTNTHPAIVNLTQDFFFAIVALTATVFVFKKLRTSYGLFMAATLAVALATGPLQSIGRYSMVLFPMFIWMASVKNEQLRLAWPLLSTLLLAANIMAFVNSYWAG